MYVYEGATNKTNKEKKGNNIKSIAINSKDSTCANVCCVALVYFAIEIETMWHTHTHNQFDQFG